MERLFLFVLHTGITESYFILAVAAVRLLLKKAPKAMICALWIAVGLRLLCPFRIETPFGLLPKQTALFLQQAYEYDEDLPSEGAKKPKETKVWEAGEINAVSEGNNRVSEPKAATVLVTAAAWIWFAGMIFLYTHLLFHWHRIKKRVQEAVPAESQGIRFYQCDRILSPFLFGLAAPKIYVPFSVAGQELFYVLKHEAAHKRRCDHLTKPAGYALLAVYWFQPLVWAAYLLFCRDMELACDERVVKEIGEGCKKEYSQALLSCCTSHLPITACPTAFGEIGVKKRVKNILNYKKPGIIMIAAAAIVCVVITACFTTEAKNSSPGEQAQAEDTATHKGIEKSVTAWAKAFCDREGEVIYHMLDQAARESLNSQNMLEGKHSFGWSSPWPWGVEDANQQQNYRIQSFSETSAEILYYAWTSDPHVTVWRQVISYQYSEKKDAIVIHSVSNDTLDDIQTTEQFYAAYPDGEISHTRMDYSYNGAGEALNQSLLTDSSGILVQPDTAAAYLLNISSDPSLVKKEVKEQDGETTVTFIFLKDGGRASVKMERLFGEEHNLWVPQTSEMVYYTF